MNWMWGLKEKEEDDFKASGLAAGRMELLLTELRKAAGGQVGECL